MADGDRVEVYQDKAGGFRWRLKAANGRIISDSAEPYPRLRYAREAAQRVHPDVPIRVLAEDAYDPYTEIEE